jgi:recombination protein RecA
MALDPSVLQVIKDINKKHGEGTVVKASEITSDMMPRFTTGSLGLDLILGGGWPGNQWSEIVGEESSGKTAVAMKTIAANQAVDPEFTAVWIAAEEWVPDYAIMLGVDLDRVIVVETNISEHAFDAALKFADTKNIDCIVIDSMPALIPSPEDEKDMEGNTMGQQARIVNKFFRKTGAVMKRSLIEHERPILGLVIQQYRSKIGVMYGSDKTTPGGQGKNYAYFARVEVKRDAWIEEGPKTAKVKVGQNIRVRTTKNKSSRPQQTAYIDFYFTESKDEGLPAGAYDWAKELTAIGIMFGVIERSGSWYSYGTHKWQGVDNIVPDVRQFPDLFEAIEKEIRTLRPNLPGSSDD